MRIVLAPDSFKECLGAPAVCAALTEGIRRAEPKAEVVAVPMADGGEGTLDVVVAATHAEVVPRTVTGPLGQPVTAAYAWIADTQSVWVESARACGLELIPSAQRNPLLTTTRGVGELLGAALAHGARRVTLSIGGSGTVDGGTGLARALGFGFRDDAGQELPEGGGSLRRLAQVVFPQSRPWAECTLQVACDVRNPLLGETGAARVFGPQKGATPAMVEELEEGLARLAEVLRRDHGVDLATVPGAGAAGGLGAGLMAFCGATLVPGVEAITTLVGLPRKLAAADLVITGEGQTDAQTAGGKVPAGVGQLAARLGVPCVVISGAVTAPLATLRSCGITAAFSLCRGPLTREEAMRRAPELLAETAANVVGLFNVERALL